jgi:hypothetical protein
MKYYGYVKYIDLYGIPCNFTLFNETLTRSTFGGLMTILTIISFVLSFLYFSKDFYLRINPNLLVQHEILPTFPSYNITNDEIFLSLNFVDNNDMIVDYTGYFEFSAYYFKFNHSFKDLIEYRGEIPIKNCSDYNNQKTKIVDASKLRNSICYDFNNMTIDGYWSQDILYYFDVRLVPCVNRTDSSIICKSLQEIINKVKSGIFISIYTSSYYLMTSDQNYPLKEASSLSYIQIDQKNGKYYNYYYKKGTVIQDTGILFQSIYNYTLLGMDYMIGDSYSINDIEEKTTFLIFNLFPSKTRETFYLKYVKIQEAFANIGGILNVITLVFSNIAILFTKYERNFDILNKIFDFNGFDKNETIKELIKQQFKIIKRKNKKKKSSNKNLNTKVVLNENNVELNQNDYNCSEYKDIQPQQDNIRKKGRVDVDARNKIIKFDRIRGGNC